MTLGRFDLNIEEVLSDWTIVSAVREIIANALDEQKLSNSDDISIIEHSDGEWHIIDYGRGLAAEHLTLKESEEKLESDLPLIGKFGVGLKDALATLHRNGVEVEIYSSKGTFRLVTDSKQEFEHIITLQVDYDSSACIEVGTEVRLIGIESFEIKGATRLFLELSGQNVIETNLLGQVINPEGATPGVYIHGVRVNDEPDFLFSYNISNLDSQLSRFLNRERQAVSRTAYGTMLREMLLECEAELIRNSLAAELEDRHYKESCYEVRRWADVGVFALERLCEQKSVVAVSQHQLEYDRHHIDDMRKEGTLPILMKEQELKRVRKLQQEFNTNIRLLKDWIKQDQEKYNLDPVAEAEMSKSERNVFATRNRLMRLVGIPEDDEPEIIVSNTTRPPKNIGEAGGEIVQTHVVGYYTRLTDTIVIHRGQLKTKVDFAGTLLHELAHRTSHRPDVDRGFELELTRYLGMVGASAVERR